MRRGKPTARRFCEWRSTSTTASPANWKAEHNTRIHCSPAEIYCHHPRIPLQVNASEVVLLLGEHKSPRFRLLPRKGRKGSVAQNHCCAQHRVAVVVPICLRASSKREAV